MYIEYIKFLAHSYPTSSRKWQSKYQKYSGITYSQLRSRVIGDVGSEMKYWYICRRVELLILWFVALLRSVGLSEYF